MRKHVAGFAKRRGFLAMCVGYNGKVLIPLWFVHEDSHLVYKNNVKMVRFHRYFVSSFRRMEICYVMLLSRMAVVYHIFSLNLK